jgi:hypothetical protein
MRRTPRTPTGTGAHRPACISSVARDLPGGLLIEGAECQIVLPAQTRKAVLPEHNPLHPRQPEVPRLEREDAPTIL